MSEGRASAELVVVEMVAMAGVSVTSTMEDVEVTEMGRAMMVAVTDFQGACEALNADGGPVSELVAVFTFLHRVNLAVKVLLRAAALAAPLEDLVSNGLISLVIQNVDEDLVHVRSINLYHIGVNEVRRSECVQCGLAHGSGFECVVQVHDEQVNSATL